MERFGEALFNTFVTVLAQSCLYFFVPSTVTASLCQLESVATVTLYCISQVSGWMEKYLNKLLSLVLLDFKGQKENNL